MGSGRATADCRDSIVCSFVLSQLTSAPRVSNVHAFSRWRGGNAYASALSDAIVHSNSLGDAVPYAESFGASYASRRWDVIDLFA